MSRLSVKELRPLSYFLGVEVIPTVGSVLLFKYIDNLLKKVQTGNAKICYFSNVSNHVSILHDGTSVTNATAYGFIVSTLQYLSLMRPEVALVVKKLAEFMHQPITGHWSTVKCSWEQMALEIFARYDSLWFIS